MAELKLASGLWVFDSGCDRFVPGGYRDRVAFRELLDLAAKVPGLKGVECHESDFDDFDIAEYKRVLDGHGLVTSNVNTNVWGKREFTRGAFSHPDAKIRSAAVGRGKNAVDIAKEVGAASIGLWLGADGFDYPFQVHYVKHWDYMMDSIRQVAEHAAQAGVKVGIEYKLKEPRTHMSICDCGKAMAACQELGMDNVGVVIDFGHSLMARENPAEQLAYLHRSKKLFNVHFNDCYGEWDDDMIAGTVRFWETLEFIYYVKECGYDGWLGLDQFPFREDPVKAATMSIRNMLGMWEMVSKLDVPALKAAQANADAIATQEIIRKVVFSN